MRTGRRLSDIRALVPEVLESSARTLPDCAGQLVVAGSEITSTGMAVTFLAGAGGPPSFVIKMPMTAVAAEGLDRETKVLTRLHADERLGEWRTLIPRPLAYGTIGHESYRVDEALGGTPAESRLAEGGASSRWQQSAAESIHFLHRSTASVVQGDAVLAESWIDARLRELWPRGVRSRRQRLRIETLRHELHEAVIGRTLRTSWVHGDFWLGNVLASERAGTIRGIVDWEAGAPAELAVHDVMHLVLYTRRLATGQELGRILCDQLRGAPWADHERGLLERYAAWGRNDSLSNRHAVLLYWLRQAASHSRQEGRRGGARHRVWKARNVYSVLAAA